MTTYLYRLPDGSDDTPTPDGRHTKTAGVLHSAAQYARFPGCEECRGIHEYETNPPPPRPQPRVLTAADLVDGAGAALAALRADCAAYHACWPQYAGWADDTALGIVTRRIGGGRTYVRAEVGDLVLIKPPAPPAEPGDITAWCPRVASAVRTDARHVGSDRRP